MLVNALRSHLAEFGIVAPRGLNKVKDPVAVVAGDGIAEASTWGPCRASKQSVASANCSHVAKHGREGFVHEARNRSILFRCGQAG